MPMREGGIVRLYALANNAEAGFMPREQLSQVCELFYSYSTAGVTRMYAALGANRSIDLLIRCWNATSLPDGVMYAIPEDGKQYRIDMAQPIYDEDAIDLTLVRLEANYDVAPE